MTVSNDTTESVVAAFQAPIWIDKDDADAVWFGTINWCVQEPNPHKPGDGSVARIVAGVRDGLADAVALAPALIAGDEAYLHTFERQHKVYVRPDGEHVVLNLDYIRAVEELLQDEDEFGDPVPADYKLVQVGEALRPVAFIDPVGDQLLALIMPVRHLG